MTKAELRDLRLAIMHGHQLTNEQALAVVSVLEDVVGVVERATGSLAPDRIDIFSSHLNSNRCAMSMAGERCPNEACVSDVRVTLRGAGPLP